MSFGFVYDTLSEKVQVFCEGVRVVIVFIDGMRKDFYFVEFHIFGNFELNIFMYIFMDVLDWNAEL